MFAKTALFLLIIFSLFLPLGWKTIRGPSVRHYLTGPLNQVLFPEKETLLDPLAEKALSQPYFYWNKGRECDVFLSQDGYFVLKIPRAKRFRSPRCFQTAMRFFASETALLYAHYGHQEKSLPKALALYDRLQRRLKLDLEFCPFVLQKRVRLLKTALEEGKREESELLLICFLDLVAIEKKRGWMCTDFAFASNFGVEGSKVVRIDIGSYEPADASFSWKRIAKPICRYLKDKDPSLHLFFEEKVEQYEEASLGESR